MSESNQSEGSFLDLISLEARNLELTLDKALTEPQIGAWYSTFDRLRGIYQAIFLNVVLCRHNYRIAFLEKSVVTMNNNMEIMTNIITEQSELLRLLQKKDPLNYKNIRPSDN